jgi:hypothetical protein
MIFDVKYNAYLRAVSQRRGDRLLERTRVVPRRKGEVRADRKLLATGMASTARQPCSI